MQYIRLTFFILLLFTGLIGFGQSPQIDSLKKVLSSASNDTNKVKTLIELARKLRSPDPEKSLEFANQVFSLSEELGYEKGKGYGYKWIGMYYFDKSEWVPANENWEKSLAIFQKMNDIEGIASILNNLGSIYWNQGNQAKALEFFLPALEAGEKSGDLLRLATTLQNIGLIYMEKQATYNESLKYFNRALALAEKIDDKDNISACNVNMGELYLKMNNDSIALYHFARAKKAAESINSFNLPYILCQLGNLMKIRGDLDAANKWYMDAYQKAEAQGNQKSMVTSANYIADIYRLKKQPKEAIKYLKLASELAAKINTPADLRNSYKGLADTYGDIADYKNAYLYQSMYSNLADTLYNLSSDSIQTKFEVAQREKEISLLTKDKKLVEEEIKRQKLVRNALIVGFALVSMMIFILYRDYRNKIKTNKLLDQRKAEIESLLLNILPYEVAVELQNTGQATPRFYDNASVLFTDFVSFSKIAESLSPQQVVEELNEFFIAMDNIIEKYQLEKIKTIGDSYMCAGGIPTVNQTHPVAIVKAGLEILDYLSIKNIHRENTGLPKWELRIGIHTGPLVAGVVGKKKYAYDIWGSTVNIASRMESNGQPGLLNISSALYEQVKDRFDCTYRGKIYAKNVGEIDMYFVNKEINPAIVFPKEALIAEN